jgi:hypothetical protein
MSHPVAPDAIEIRDALGFALSDALGSLDDCELYLSDEVADGLVDNVDEAQAFVRDALFEALNAFGTHEGDELVWRAGDGEAVVFQAPAERRGGSDRHARGQHRRGLSYGRRRASARRLSTSPAPGYQT